MEFRKRVELDSGVRLAAVAYADWERAGAPPPDEIAKLARDHRFAALLIDTGRKDGRTLLDSMALANVIETCDRFRRVGTPVALAGSLGRDEIRRLCHARPTWFAVRGSACTGNSRTAAIDAEKVRLLVDELTLNHRPED
jgi:uncharacterized protein (UPF0264 family)